jgi:MFS family permease
VWALVSGCTAATNSFASLLTFRVFLGIVEAPFFPGAIYFLSCWYTKRELGIRMALLVSGIVISNAFAGLISAGILESMNGRTAISSWRWLFIIEGLITIVVAICAMFCLPDYPATTKWLTEEEKTVTQARLIKDIGAENALGEEKISLMQAFIMAAKDYRVWVFACMQMATTASISYPHFFQLSSRSSASMTTCSSFYSRRRTMWLPSSGALALAGTPTGSRSGRRMRPSP